MAISYLKKLPGSKIRVLPMPDSPLLQNDLFQTGYRIQFSEGKHQGEVVPIEVKAGKTGGMKSLLRFIQEKNTSLAVRFDTNPPSVQAVNHQLGNGAGKSNRVEFDLLSLPLYMVEEMQRLLTSQLTEKTRRHNE